MLDFVGRHHIEFRLDRRFRALLGGSRKDLERQIADDFPFLPAGCHMELDPVAADTVLRNIREAIPSRWTVKVEELRHLSAGGRDVMLGHYIDETGLELQDVYAGNRSWTDLRQAAGLQIQPPGPQEESLRRACGRMLHVDDLERLDSYRRLLALSSVPDLATLSICEYRLIRMLVASIADQALTMKASLREICDLVWAHPQVRAELVELLEVLESRVDHVRQPLATHADVPLTIHSRYTRIEILAAFGVGDTGLVSPWQTGCYYARDAGADLFAFTLDKTSGQFSPTTRYRDYAISRELIHWESQSVTRSDSETGQRYQKHADLGHAIMLFARLRTAERSFWFLGPATYVSHESERPMAVTWRLEYPLPGDLFAVFAAAVA